jgi:hypothetical protein
VLPVWRCSGLFIRQFRELRLLQAYYETSDEQDIM